MVVTWSAVPGAASYNLYWSTSSAVSPTSAGVHTIAGLTGLTYTLTGLTRDTTYYFVITAVNSAGPGPVSTTASATPPWSGGTQVDVQAWGTAIYPDSVSANDTGTSLAVWEDNYGASGSNWLYVNVAQSGVWGSWSSAPLATSSNGAAGSTTPAGDAMVVYVAGSGVNATSGLMSSSNIDVQIYNHGTKTWSAPRMIGGSTALNTFVVDPSVAVDGSGNAMAVWEDANASQIYAAQYNATSGSWGVPAQISSAASGVNTTNTQVVATGTNGFTAIWAQTDAAGTSPYAAKFSGTAWSAPISIGFAPSTTTGYYSGNLSASASGNGNIAVVWHAETSTSTTTGVVYAYGIAGSQYNSTAGTWSAATNLVAQDTANNYFYPKVATDGLGNAKAVWEKYNIAALTSTVWGASYTSGAGWATAQQLDQANGDNTSNPAIGMDSLGNAQLVYYDATLGTVARNYDATLASWQSSWNTNAFAGKSTSKPIFNMSPAGYGVLFGYDPSAGAYTEATGYFCSPCIAAFAYTFVP